MCEPWRTACTSLVRFPCLRRVASGPPLSSRRPLEIRLAIRRYKLDGPRLAWFSQPLAAPLLGRLGERASLLYYQDRYDAFQHVDGPRVRANLAELARRCELSIASAEPLADELRVLGADPIVLHHGVEVERFATPAPAPGDLTELERPLVGFVGLIEPYLDLGTIVKVADSLERGTVVLVGDVNVDRRLLNHERIALLGRRDYELMPAYLQAFQVCLLPFKMDRLTEGVDPLKLREYLAAGRPVVSTPLPSVLPYASVIKLASGPLEFAAAVRSALDPGEDTSEARARRRARVAGESWDAVAAHLETLIEPLMNRRA